MVVGALVSTSKKLKTCIELEVSISTDLLQKTALLGTAPTSRKVLDCGQGWGRKKCEKGGGEGEEFPKPNR